MNTAEKRTQFEVITIGNEILSGAVSNLNARYACKRLSAAGFRIRGIVSVGDVFEDIRDALLRAVDNSPFVLVTGGLGPTPDDITTRSVAEIFGRPLRLDAHLLESIREHLERRNLPWSKDFERLAYLPERSGRIDPAGDMCGYMLQERDATVFFLPGVPEEMNRLLDEFVIPYALRNTGAPCRLAVKLYKVFGIHEQAVAEAIRDLEHSYSDAFIGYYPQYPEVHVSLTVFGETREEVDSRLETLDRLIRDRLGHRVFGNDQQTLESVVGDLLRSRNASLAVAESCTGGLIGHRITSVPGSSDYFERGVIAYSNRTKMDLLGVDPAVLEAHGAVSAECAEAMAVGVRTSAGTTFGLSCTGIAGPGGGSEEKPVGTVHIGLASEKGATSKKYQFFGTREQVKIITSETALHWIWRAMNHDPFFHRL